MSLRKDDPVYYKKKIIELFKQAQENGLEIELNETDRLLCFRDMVTMEMTAVNLKEVVDIITVINRCYQKLGDR
jgi:hypothetical protein